MTSSFSVAFGSTSSFGSTGFGSTSSFGSSGFGSTGFVSTAAPPSCSSCKKDCSRGVDGVRMCKQCLEGLNNEIDSLRSANDQLKGQIQELESKVKFLGWSSPIDHLLGGDLEDDRCSSYPPDVVLVASDDDMKPEVPAHQAILINKSPVFREMLRSEMEEGQTNIIRIGEVSYHGLCSFVNYLYTAEVDLVDDQRAQDLLAMGEKYQVKHLKAYCENFLKSKVINSNALKYLAFASKYNAEVLVEASLSVITENMNKLTLQEEYKEFVRKDPHLIIRIYESYHAKKSS